MNKILFVVVLYQVDALKSQTVRSLLKCRAAAQGRAIPVLILDNTPGRESAVRVLDYDVEYIAFGENRGVSGAYQFAFLVSRARGYRYLVLLDQDSEASDEFICALDTIETEGLPKTGVWCPDIRSDGVPISPYSMNFIGWPNFSPPDGVEQIYGINSFSVVSVDLIDALGGFNQFYWLDCLDTWLYKAVHRAGWKVKRLDVSVKHNLSLVSGRVSASRMRNIAFFESCFAVEHGLILQMPVAILRVIVRGINRGTTVGGLRGFRLYCGEIVRGLRVGWQRKNRNQIESNGVR